MIGRIRGKLIEKFPPLICVDVNGIGYDVHVPMNDLYDLPALGEEVTLYTHFVVREDVQQLYGFLNNTERQTFRTVIKITGIGPRTGLAILSGISAEQLASAVEEEDLNLLCKIPGIGKKTAERIILELRGKLGAIVPAATSASPSPAMQRQDITNALMALGYSERELQRVLKELDPAIDVTEGIKQALKLLSK
ncbi:Holliday junction ATP-dependent DNA helicase RuvA [Oligella ureolytica]|uniref:Holliday junction branch migration protein RuvA n=1 Tax=Oligella ureolytica TaxID=90244 RepID=UPI000DFE59B7|nr:Holliday junction branch migration protein RuvA [Oligella ureolytica]SUA58010.1 Holliday junction ATP-dependent DNA helicase RuvA [Oligella ureolytica]